MNDLNFPDVSVLATPLYVMLILVELAIVYRHKAYGDYETRDATTSLIMGLGSVVFGIILAVTLGTLVVKTFTWVYQYRVFDLPVNLWTIALCFVLDDLRYYWSHRIQHVVRWCWASHVVHHSSQHFNLTTALRQPWFGLITGLFVLQIPLVWLGFHPAVVAFSASLNLFYQFFIHTEAVDRLPRWFEAVFNTPSHHRVHHGRNLRYLDANYAGTLIIWDKLFGTFVPEVDEEKVEYGLVTNLGTFNPLRVATHGYVEIFKDQLKSGLSFKDRVGYALAPPGWSHDGSKKTTPQMKDEFLLDHPEFRGEPGFRS
ncbi:MAG: sterol desaturase family protein [Pseudomonadota bacterium]